MVKRITKGVHFFWEIMGVALGVFLLFTGYTEFSNFSNKLIPIIMIIAGVTSIIVDGFYFAPRNR